MGTAVLDMRPRADADHSRFSHWDGANDLGICFFFIAFSGAARDRADDNGL